MKHKTPYTVNARNLYHELYPNSNAASTPWVKRQILRGTLIETRDYISFKTGHKLSFFLTAAAAQYIRDIRDVIKPVPYTDEPKNYAERGICTSDLFQYTGHKSNADLMRRIIHHAERLGLFLSLDYSMMKYRTATGTATELWLNADALNKLIDSHILELSQPILAEVEVPAPPAVEQLNVWDIPLKPTPEPVPVKEPAVSTSWIASALASIRKALDKLHV